MRWKGLKLRFAELLAQSLARDPEDLCRFALVAFDLLHDLEDVRALHGFQRSGGRRRPIVCWAAPLRYLGELRRQIVRIDRLAGRENDHSLDEVLQLAHIARPGVPEQQ